MFNYSSENFADRANNNSTSQQDDDEEMGRSNFTSGVLLIEWDDWDQSLWTAEQRQLLQRGAIPPEVHITLGVFLALIVLFGVAANSSIFYVFAR
jgi:r-opsin